MRYVDHKAQLLNKVPTAFLQSVFDTEREAKQNAHVSPTVQSIGFRRRSSAPGSLRRSVTTQFQGPLRARVGSPLPYAGIRNRGGVIRPKRARSLRFQTYDGRWHSVRQVRQKGDGWLTHAGNKWPGFFLKRLRALR
jgi:phage gpG-like protein